MKFAFIFVGGLIFFWRPFLVHRPFTRALTGHFWPLFTVIYRLLVSNFLGLGNFVSIYGRRIGRRNCVIDGRKVGFHRNFR